MLNVINGLYSSRGCASSSVDMFISPVTASLSSASRGFVSFQLPFLLFCLLHLLFLLPFRGTWQHSNAKHSSLIACVHHSCL